MSELPSYPAVTLAPEPLRIAVRRLRWFRRSFRTQVRAVEAETGLRFEIDETRLGRVFVAWLRGIEAQRPPPGQARRPFFDFAAGLMLRELLALTPLRIVAQPAAADQARPEYFWPEGFVCTIYCLEVRAAVLRQEFDETASVAPEFFNIRSWWSYRENIREDRDAAIAFLDYFTGVDPDWRMPAVFHDRMRGALLDPIREGS